MRGLFTLADVDYDQWRALVRASLTVDLRTSLFVRAPRSRKASAAAAIAGQIVFYAITGLFISFGVWISQDVFLAAVFVVTYVMFMVGTAALMDHNAAIASPDDYYILGFRPVTSRTFFAARLANVLVYTSSMTLVFGLLPMAAFFGRWGLLVGLAAVAAIAAASLFTALTMIAIYAWLLGAVGAARLKRLLSYVQFVFSFLVYGGYFAAINYLTETAIASIRLPKTLPVLMTPPAWFASYVEIASGRIGPRELIPAAASLAGVAALAVFVRGRLSLDYAQRLGELTSAGSALPAAPVADARRTRFFSGGESRAIAMLVRSQFASDLKFRMSVLAILPLTLIYLVMGVSRQGGIGDPFERNGLAEGLGFVTLAVLMFPAMLKMSLSQSDAFRASWIFFASPIERAKLVSAAKNVLLVSFVLPYLAFVALVLAFFTENVSHLLVHLVVVGLVSHLVLQIITFVDPELPFSKPHMKGRSSTRIFIILAVVTVGSVVFPLLAPLVYRTTLRIAVTLLVLAGLSLLLERMTRLRVESLSDKLEFEG